MRFVETGINQLTLRDDGVLVVRSINSDIPRTAEHVEEMYGALERLIDGRRCPVLWDPRPTRSIRPDGWVAIIERLEALFTAIAVVTDEQAADLLGGYPEAWNALLMPVRRFSDEDEALEWLQRFSG
ncbi:MAG: STAS/SEC14 domain-containing protein [Acidimicrobiia bacterium]